MAKKITSCFRVELRSSNHSLNRTSCFRVELRSSNHSLNRTSCFRVELRSSNHSLNRTSCFYVEFRSSNHITTYFFSIINDKNLHFDLINTKLFFFVYRYNNCYRISFGSYIKFNLGRRDQSILQDFSFLIEIFLNRNCIFFI